MESDVLVDSNVYIDLLKARKDVTWVLPAWAGDRNLVICGMVRLEVLRGLTSLKLMTRLSAFMDVLCNVPGDDLFWNEATDLAWKLDRKGIVIPAADAVIAASALRLGASVLTSDAHFQRIDGLRTITPPPDWFVRE